jgi:uncharacterized protein YjiS (DUF1127 family)
MRMQTMFLDAWRAFERRRRERQTLSAISELPPYMLKDIGWPGAGDRRQGSRD